MHFSRETKLTALGTNLHQSFGLRTIPNDRLIGLIIPPVGVKTDKNEIFVEKPSFSSCILILILSKNLMTGSGRHHSEPSIRVAPKRGNTVHLWQCHEVFNTNIVRPKITCPSFVLCATVRVYHCIRMPFVIKRYNFYLVRLNLFVFPTISADWAPSCWPVNQRFNNPFSKEKAPLWPAMISGSRIMQF